MYKSTKGITLIALVVSIIVLLILAGVSIAVLTGENGIINRARSAKETMKKSEEEEQIKLAIESAFIAGHGSLATHKIQEELKSNSDTYILIGNGPWSVYTKDSIYSITQSGEVKVEVSDLSAGLYKNNSIVKSWNQLIEEGTIIVQNGKLSTPRETGGGMPTSNNGNLFSASRNVLDGILVIDSAITSIEDGAFLNCANLTSVIFMGEVTDIGVDAFRNCSTLSEINLPSGLESIGKNAFSNSMLKEINIPNNCIVGEQAFLLCNNLETAIIGKNVNLGDSAFSNCLSLVTANIDSGTAIGSSSFIGLTSLKNVTIASGVTTIGTRAFAICTSIERLDVPSSVSTIGENAFAAIKHVYYTGSATGQPWGAQNFN